MNDSYLSIPDMYLGRVGGRKGTREQPVPRPSSPRFISRASCSPQFTKLAISRTSSPRSATLRTSTSPYARRSASFAPRSALARTRARQAAADEAACQDSESESIRPARIVSSLGKGAQPVQHASPSFSYHRPAIVSTEWYTSTVAGKLAAFTEMGKSVEAPPLTSVKTRWKPQPCSAPVGNYDRRRFFDKNSAGLPLARSISDLP